MATWSLSDKSIQQLLKLPETGMGFQLVSPQWQGDSAPFIVFNGELGVDLPQVDLVPGIDPSIVFANGVRVLNAIRQTGLTMVGRPEPHSFTLLESRIGGVVVTSLGTGVAAPTSQIAQPSSLTKVVTLSASNSARSRLPLAKRVEELRLTCPTE
ncbi:MAG TPA: hypothetical protein VN950_26860 [Terriglobales bacterium]|nr:hypothetical protein [Terriglobales bacterium]